MDVSHRELQQKNRWGGKGSWEPGVKVFMPERG